jgi:hypothetical protein
MASYVCLFGLFDRLYHVMYMKCEAILIMTSRRMFFRLLFGISL